MSDANTGHGLSVQRSEALSDGIFAVAMTLLVIELKLPDHGAVATEEALNHALRDLLPKMFAWVLSFCVLAIFWFGHHRAFSHVRRVDGRLIALNIAELAFVSLMPFSCALVGEHNGALASQAIYAANMVAISTMALLASRYIHRHAESSAMAMSVSEYRGARFRLLGLMLLSLLTVGMHMLLPGAGNMVYVLMGAVMPLSRRVERAAAAHA